MVSENSFCLYQKKVQDKSNEITAIPDALDTIDECAFKTHSGHDVIETLEKDHGRIEKRTCSILPAKKYLMEETLSKWAHISTIIKLVSTSLIIVEMMRAKLLITSR